jgi:hypothetical protein
VDASPLQQELARAVQRLVVLDRTCGSQMMEPKAADAPGWERQLAAHGVDRTSNISLCYIRERAVQGR